MGENKMRTPRQLLEEIAKSINLPSGKLRPFVFSGYLQGASGPDLTYQLRSGDIILNQKVSFYYDREEGLDAIKELVKEKRVLYRSPYAYYKFWDDYAKGKFGKPKSEGSIQDSPIPRIAQLYPKVVKNSRTRAVFVESGDRISLIDNRTARSFFDKVDESFVRGDRDVSYELHCSGLVFRFSDYGMDCYVQAVLRNYPLENIIDTMEEYHKRLTFLRMIGQRHIEWMSLIKAKEAARKEREKAGKVK